MRVVGRLIGVGAVLLALFAGLLVALNVAFPGALPGFAWGLDFQGGSLFEYRAEVPPEADVDATMRQVAEVVRRRMEAGSHDVAYIGVRGTVLRIELNGEVDRSEPTLVSLARTPVLAFRVVDDETRIAAYERPPPRGVELVRESVHSVGVVPYFRASGREAPSRLTAFVSALDVPAESELLIQTSHERGASDVHELVARTFLVRREAPVTGADVADATAMRDEMTQQPAVTLVLSTRGAAAMERLTRAQLHRRLAIVYDGAVLMAPVVQSPIRERVQITLGAMEAPADALAEAEVLAASLRSGALPAALVLEREQVVHATFDATERAAILALVPAFLLLMSIAGTVRYLKQFPAPWTGLFALAGAALFSSFFEVTVTATYMVGIHVAALLALVLGWVIAWRAFRERTRGATLLLSALAPLVLSFVGMAATWIVDGPWRGAATGLAFGAAGALPFSTLAGASAFLVQGPPPPRTSAPGLGATDG